MFTFAFPLNADESIEYSLARGGRLYDKWFNENETEKPKEYKIKEINKNMMSSNHENNYIKNNQMFNSK